MNFCCTCCRASDLYSQFFTSSLTCDGFSSSNDEGKTKCFLIGQEISSFLTSKWRNSIQFFFRHSKGLNWWTNNVGFESTCSLRSWRYCRRSRNKVLAAEPPETSGDSKSHSLFSSRLRRSLVGSAAKTLFRVRLQYRQLRRLKILWPVENSFTGRVYKSNVVKRKLIWSPLKWFEMNLKFTDAIIILTGCTNCLRTNVRYVLKFEKVSLGCQRLSTHLMFQNITYLCFSTIEFLSKFAYSCQSFVIFVFFFDLKTFSNKSFLAFRFVLSFSMIQWCL